MFKRRAKNIFNFNPLLKSELGSVYVGDWKISGIDIGNFSLLSQEPR